MTPGPGTEPELQWWEPSALNTVPLMRPVLPDVIAQAEAAREQPYDHVKLYWLPMHENLQFKQYVWFYWK